MISIGGTDIAQNLSLFLLALVILGATWIVMAGIARRRGSSSVTLDVTRSLAVLWLILCAIGVLFTVYNTLLAPQLSLELPAAVVDPDGSSCGATNDGSSSDSASAVATQIVSACPATVTAEVAGVRLGPRLLFAAAGLLQLLALASPAVALAVLLKNARLGTPFVPSVPKWLIFSGVVMLVAGIGQEALGAIGRAVVVQDVLAGTNDPGLPFTMTIPAWPIAAALISAALATVFRHGIRLQRETEGLV